MPIPNRFGDNDNKDMSETSPTGGSLVSWVVGKVRRAREVRDEQYKDRWKEYTRLWRGFWTEEDQNTSSERSRIISPALQQAIEMTVAEMEETTFNRTAWFDIDDDIADENKEDAIAYRDQLLEDFELVDVKDAVAQTFLNGAIYGTGIAKINVSRKNVPVRQGSETVVSQKVVVTLNPVRPDEFVIDPSARNVEEALFVAHEMIKPVHGIKEKQATGVYKPGNIMPWGQETGTDPTGTGYMNIQKQDDGALILEYFGKVPSWMLPGGSLEDTGMTEALVTIANENVLLKAVPSPFTHKDRPIIAYQHDTVPGEFWGRGVSEKGYNPQKALDAEMRARMDALALTTAPMLGADITRLPRNPNMAIRPGKTFLTRGRPSEIIEPIGFSPQGLALTFQQSGNLERMVQMGTGAMDSSTPNNISRRNETMGGMSMIQSGFIKRAKRTMYNVERHFIDPLVKKSLWRYMQFDEERYPYDATFIVNSTMGMMAKEMENQQLIQALGFVPPESPAHNIVVQALLENAISDKKAELHKAIKAINQPPTPEEEHKQKQLEEMQMQLQQLAIAKEQAEVAKLKAEAELAQERARHERIEADLEDDRLQIEAANAVTGAEKARVSREQIAVNRERNVIEDKKASQAASKSNDK